MEQGPDDDEFESEDDDELLLKPLEPGTMVDDRYSIVRVIGRGGMGTIYAAEHVRLRRHVALKILHPYFVDDADQLQRFQREARAATVIKSSHVVEVTDLGVQPGLAYMAMELLEGHDLARELKERGPVAFPRAIRIAMQICDALSAAHSEGIVHRDLKPENVFLSVREGVTDYVKVLDFGLARFTAMARHLASSGSITRTGTLLGTMHYMAPEQVMAEKDIDGRADLFALGVIMYRMLTGNFPFDATSYPLLAVAIVQNTPPPVRSIRSDVPAHFEPVLNRLMAKGKAQRFQNAAATRSALSLFAAGKR